MIRLWALSALLFWPSAGLADSVVATRLIRATEVIGPDDVIVQPVAHAGAALNPNDVIGLETRIAIYPGRPVRPADLGPAAVIERNDVVQMAYRRGGLMILSEGRALGRAALGEQITVMNLSSRQSVQGTATGYGLIEVIGARGATQ